MHLSPKKSINCRNQIPLGQAIIRYSNLYIRRSDKSQVWAGEGVSSGLSLRSIVTSGAAEGEGEGEGDLVNLPPAALLAVAAVVFGLRREPGGQGKFLSIFDRIS